MPCPRSRWTAPVNPRHPPPDALADETEPVVVRRAAFGGHALHGEGTLWRAIYPDLAGSRRLFVGLAEFAPGTAPHVFHRHGSEVVGAPGARRRLTYAADFEEFYFVVDGEGELQWRLAAGGECRAPLAQGDAVYFPRRRRAPGLQHRHAHDEGAVRRHAAGAGGAPRRAPDPMTSTSAQETTRCPA